MQPVPQSMEKGSEGPAVNLLLAFLCGAECIEKNVIFDGVYANVAEKGVTEFQKKNDLEPTGKFGPETRECVKKYYNFDFEKACRSIPGTTTFVEGGAKKTIFKN